MAATTGMPWRRPRARGDALGVPRAMPLILQAADRVAGAGAGQALLALACRADDAGLVVVDEEAALATEAGLGGQRRTHTLRARLAALEAAGFVVVERRGDAPLSVALVEPHHVVSTHRVALGEAAWNGFVELVTMRGDATAVAGLSAEAR